MEPKTHNPTQEQRERDNIIALFETIEQKVEAWPAEVRDDFIAEVAGDLRSIIPRIAREGDSWQPDGTTETLATRYAAWLLVMQAALRKFNTERTPVTRNGQRRKRARNSPGAAGLTKSTSQVG